MHEEFMKLAIELARLGEGDVNPNPLVGAVVVRGGTIVGRGYHRRFGGPHAEVFALEEAGDSAREATLYVTLEPCAHYGKTPPCTDRIIASGLSSVVVALRDPHPLVNGHGIAALRGAGIEVVEGVLSGEAGFMNEIFLTAVSTGRPFVHLKLAVSLDGRIASRTGDARWISGELSRIAAHRLRRRLSSILVGVGTVVADDPRLDVRHVPGRSPVPIVLDPAGRIPLEARLVDPQRPLIVATATMPPEKEAQLVARGARIWRLPSAENRLDLPTLLDRLAAESIDSVLVEGGGETAASFLEADLVDRVTLFIAPILIGGKNAVPAIGGIGSERIADAWRLRDVRHETSGEDLMITGRLKPVPWAT